MKLAGCLHKAYIEKKTFNVNPTHDIHSLTTAAVNCSPSILQRPWGLTVRIREKFDEITSSGSCFHTSGKLASLNRSWQSNKLE
jgi:hypothetical protein